MKEKNEEDKKSNKKRNKSRERMEIVGRERAEKKNKSRKNNVGKEMF